MYTNFQLCTFNVQNCANNVRNYVQSTTKNFQIMYTIMYILRNTNFLKENTQFCIFKYINFQFYTFNVNIFSKNVHNCICVRSIHTIFKLIMRI